MVEGFSISIESLQNRKFAEKQVYGKTGLEHRKLPQMMVFSPGVRAAKHLVAAGRIVVALRTEPRVLGSRAT